MCVHPMFIGLSNIIFKIIMNKWEYDLLFNDNEVMFCLYFPLLFILVAIGAGVHNGVARLYLYSTSHMFVSHGRPAWINSSDIIIIKYIYMFDNIKHTLNILHKLLLPDCLWWRFSPSWQYVWERMFLIDCNIAFRCILIIGFSPKSRWLILGVCILSILYIIWNKLSVL